MKRNGTKKVPPMGIHLEDLTKLKEVPPTIPKTDSEKKKRDCRKTFPPMGTHLEDLTKERPQRRFGRYGQRRLGFVKSIFRWHLAVLLNA
jgi:hypothetical protein